MRTDLRLLSRRFDREWRALARRPDVLDRANAWRLVARDVADLDELLVATGYGARWNTTVHNDLLGRLVCLGHDDELAARVVLQRILRGLVAIARRRRLFEPEAFEELVGAAWLTIRQARTDGRDHLAAGLVRDAAYRAFTAPGRRLSSAEIATDPRVLDEEPAIEQLAAGEELARLLAEARACGVPTADVDLFRDLAAIGSPGRLAEIRRITPRTVRNHRDRAAARLRRFAAA